MNRSRGRSLYGAARFTSSNNRSTFHCSPTHTVAASCCASTSRHPCGMCASSISRRSIRDATTAASSRSGRYFGMILPVAVSPTRCPARPTRCNPAVAVFGDSICTTRSIAPTSIPSSSELVATSAGSSPRFSRSSTSLRASRETLPWCTRHTTSPARSFTCAATRSALARSFTKISVEWCARISSSSRSKIDGHTLSPGRSRKSSTGDSTTRSISLRPPASSTSISRGAPFS